MYRVTYFSRSLNRASERRFRSMRDAIRFATDVQVNLRRAGLLDLARKVTIEEVA